MNLFQSGQFKLHSGEETDFKIECDALTDEDWATLAQVIRKRFVYSAVTGVPRGGLKLAELLVPYITPKSRRHLIVDDVYTTGTSMRDMRDKCQVTMADYGPRGYHIGVVVFARARIQGKDGWIKPIFQMIS